nr:reverse transcriptase domain-containing protein [Tanacetum cinerariifolium]
MTTLAEFMIIADVDNRPPMLEKSLYDTWKSHMELYMENKENGRMILESVQNGPLVWPIITKEYGLPPDVLYDIIKHHKVAKEIWDKVKLLMQGTKLSLQEKEYKLYDEFDKFTFVKGETLYQYYWRFSQLINNMNVINMLMRLVQVNIKFLNSLPLEWNQVHASSANGITGDCQRGLPSVSDISGLYFYKNCKACEGSKFTLRVLMVKVKREGKVAPTIVEILVVTMADQCTMAKLLQAPTESYEDAIVIPAILAENFELKHGLLNLITSKQLYGHDKEDPHAYIRWFNKITSAMRYPSVPNTSIKLMLFPFSIEGAARIWLEKEPPRSILTWEDLVSKFINQFFPPSKMTNICNEITNFQQRFDESFCEAWDQFKDLLRACPHHGFTELHQLDTFYNAINPIDQDSLNSAAGGNFLDKMPRDCLRIIESKSKVCNS